MERHIPAPAADAAAAIDPVHERELFLLEWEITEELNMVIPQAAPLDAPAIPVF